MCLDPRTPYDAYIGWNRQMDFTAGAPPGILDYDAPTGSIFVY
jgi:hypothetical protein